MVYRFTEADYSRHMSGTGGEKSSTLFSDITDADKPSSRCRLSRSRNAKGTLRERYILSLLPIDKKIISPGPSSSGICRRASLGPKKCILGHEFSRPHGAP